MDANENSCSDDRFSSRRGPDYPSSYIHPRVAGQLHHDRHQTPAVLSPNPQTPSSYPPVRNIANMQVENPNWNGRTNYISDTHQYWDIHPSLLNSRNISSIAVPPQQQLQQFQAPAEVDDAVGFIRNDYISRRKPRVVLAENQAAHLWSFYQRDAFPSQRQRLDLASALEVNQEVIENWFKNRRSEERRGRLPSQIRLHRDRISLPAFQQGAEEESGSQIRAIPTGNRTGNLAQRLRTYIFPHQRHALEERFQENPHPSFEEYNECAQLLGLSLSVVRNWFKNRRQLEKRQERQGSATTDAR